MVISQGGTYACLDQQGVDIRFPISFSSQWNAFAQPQATAEGGALNAYDGILCSMDKYSFTNFEHVGIWSSKNNAFVATYGAWIAVGI